MRKSRKTKKKVIFVEIPPLRKFSEKEISNKLISHFEEIVKNCSGFGLDEFYLIETLESEIITFGNAFQSKPFTKFFEMEELKDSERIFPLEIKLVRFKNYKVERFIEDVWFPRDLVNMTKRIIYLNADHLFSKMLLKNKKKISSVRTKNAISDFFESVLKLRSSFDFRKTSKTKRFKNTLEKQKKILRQLIKDKLISVSEVRYYKLTKEDFPPIWFDDEGE